jgi:hypothetical protein
VRRRLRDARFINICMKATLFGAAAPTASRTGRVVSGVGGQYNFVAMAHELAGARSILLLRSTRERAASSSRISSTTTATRRSRAICATSWSPSTASRTCAASTDAEVAGALIASPTGASRMRSAARAVAPASCRAVGGFPKRALGNTPQALAARLAPLARQGPAAGVSARHGFRRRGAALVPALRWLKESASHWRGRWQRGAASPARAPRRGCALRSPAWASMRRAGSAASLLRRWWHCRSAKRRMRCNGVKANVKPVVTVSRVRFSAMSLFRDIAVNEKAQAPMLYCLPAG